jgi:hypothetical protein
MKYAEPRMCGSNGKKLWGYLMLGRGFEPAIPLFSKISVLFSPLGSSNKKQLMKYVEETLSELLKLAS